MEIIRECRAGSIGPLMGRNVLAVMKEGDYYYGRVIQFGEDDMMLGECLQGNGSFPVGAKITGMRSRRRKGKVRAVAPEGFAGTPPYAMQPGFDPYGGARPIGTYTARYADLAFLLAFPFMF